MLLLTMLVGGGYRAHDDVVRDLVVRVAADDGGADARLPPSFRGVDVEPDDVSLEKSRINPQKTLAIPPRAVYTL
jgi:hypothetical protein